jgi:hypothetical protein
MCGAAATLLCAGQGTDEDIVVSSARAYVAALNKLVAWRTKQQQQQQKEAGAGSAAAGHGTQQDATATAKKGANAGKGSGRLVAARALPPKP